jgi:hypothetical protein
VHRWLLLLLLLLLPPPHLVDISIAKRTPPTGALKAVHTPQAAPQATKSLMSLL